MLNYTIESGNSERFFIGNRSPPNLNLTATNLSSVSYWIQYHAKHINFSISNTGNTTVRNANVSLFINDSYVNSSSIMVKAQSSNSSIIRANITATGGPYIIKLSVDPEDKIGEMNESDNNYSKIVNVRFAMNLSIWDETDTPKLYTTGPKIPNEQVLFFANYTNFSSSPPNMTIWWNSSWSRRIEVNITEPYSVSRTHDVAYVLFNHGGKARTDCRDVRVLDNNSHLLPRKIGICNSSHMEIAFPVNISASQTRTYYIYWGNKKAESYRTAFPDINWYGLNDEDDYSRSGMKYNRFRPYKKNGNWTLVMDWGGAGTLSDYVGIRGYYTSRYISDENISGEQISHYSQENDEDDSKYSEDGITWTMTDCYDDCDYFINNWFNPAFKNEFDIGTRAPCGGSSIRCDYGNISITMPGNEDPDAVLIFINDTYGSCYFNGTPISTNRYYNATPRTFGFNLNIGQETVFAECNISFNYSGITSPWAMMWYNASKKLFEYNKSFPEDGHFIWNVSCGGIWFEHKKANDTIDISSSPDFQVFPENISYPEYLLQYQKVQVNISVYNDGNINGNSVNVTLWQGTQYVNSTYIDIPGKTSAVARINWTPSKGGFAYLNVSVDPLDKITESFENNNNATVEVNITFATTLDIWDSTDTPKPHTTGKVYQGQTAKFFANFTNGSDPAFDPTWWNISWNMRKKITIEETYGVSRIHDVVYIHFDPDGFVRSDCEDIRVYDIANSRLVSRKIGNCSPNDVWISFPINISASSSKDYYIYYSNPTASKGNSTFPALNWYGLNDEDNYSRAGFRYNRLKPYKYGGYWYITFDWGAAGTPNAPSGIRGYFFSYFANESKIEGYAIDYSSQDSDNDDQAYSDDGSSWTMMDCRDGCDYLLGPETPQHKHEWVGGAVAPCSSGTKCDYGYLKIRIPENEDPDSILFNITIKNNTAYWNDTEILGLGAYNVTPRSYGFDYHNSTPETVSNCFISFNISGGWTDWAGMTYNQSNELYMYWKVFEQPGVYTWNVSCAAPLVQGQNKSDTITISGSPDLNVTESSIKAPQVGRPWHRVEFNITVNNTGYDKSPFTNITLWINTSYLNSSRLNISMLSRNHTMFFWTPSSPGNYLLNLSADPNNEKEESFEDNNNITKLFLVRYEALLQIWDSTDPKGGSHIIYPDQKANFYANYTNASGYPINKSLASDAHCNISIYNETTDRWIGRPMRYNTTSQLYEFNRTFSLEGAYEWNVTCKATNYDTKQLFDTIYIGQAPELELRRENISISPELIYKGNRTLLNITVFNLGTENSAYTNISVYIDDSYFNSTRINISKQSYNRTTFFWYAIKGNHTIKISADPDDEKSENDESNNNISINVTVFEWANLSIWDQTDEPRPYTTGAAFAGSPVKFYANFSNASSGALTDDYYSGWWNKSWSYRLEYQINESLGYNRVREPITVVVNFSQYPLLQGRSIDRNSIRIISNNKVNQINGHPYVITWNEDYSSALPEATITFDLNISANDITKFWLYFDTTDNENKSAAAFGDYYVFHYFVRIANLIDIMSIHDNNSIWIEDLDDDGEILHSQYFSNKPAGWRYVNKSHDPDNVIIHSTYPVFIYAGLVSTWGTNLNDLEGTIYAIQDPVHGNYSFYGRRFYFHSTNHTSSGTRAWFLTYENTPVNVTIKHFLTGTLITKLQITSSNMQPGGSPLTYDFADGTDVLIEADSDIWIITGEDDAFTSRDVGYTPLRKNRTYYLFPYSTGSTGIAQVFGKPNTNVTFNWSSGSTWRLIPSDGRLIFVESLTNGGRIMEVSANDTIAVSWVTVNDQSSFAAVYDENHFAMGLNLSFVFNGSGYMPINISIFTLSDATDFVYNDSGSAPNEYVQNNLNAWKAYRIQDGSGTSYIKGRVRANKPVIVYYGGERPVATNNDELHTATPIITRLQYSAPLQQNNFRKQTACELLINVSGGWARRPMQYNDSKKLYEATYTFSKGGHYYWNVSCQGIYTELKKANDSIDVIKTVSVKAIKRVNDTTHSVSINVSNMMDITIGPVILYDFVPENITAFSFTTAPTDSDTIGGDLHGTVYIWDLGYFEPGDWANINYSFSVDGLVKLSEFHIVGIDPLLPLGSNSSHAQQRGRSKRVLPHLPFKRTSPPTPHFMFFAEGERKILTPAHYPPSQFYLKLANWLKRKKKKT